MLPQKQLKGLGLRYARSLQIAIRTAGMLSVDHTVASGPVKQSFDLLTGLMKDAGTLTIGFVDGRVMLNNVLTVDAGLSQLENEFLKRGVGAVRFDVGLTLARYKQVIGLLSTPLKEIEERGGVGAFLERAVVEGVRIVPAGKNQKRTDEGDTLLEMDPEAFFRARDASTNAAAASPPGPEQALMMFFDSAGVPRPEGAVGGPEDIMRLVSPTIESALTSQNADPQKAYIALAQVMQGMRLDSVLSAFPPARHEELKGMEPKQLAAELIGDVSLAWASKRLAAAPSGENAFVVEEEVVRVLARSLYATQTAGKLANKLAQFVKEYGFPESTSQKVQDELRWVALPPEEKHRALMSKVHYNAVEFRRLIEHIRELLTKGRAPEVAELAQHYFEFFNGPVEEVTLEELSRAPQLVQTISGVKAGLARHLTEVLLEQLQREEFTGFKHFQLLNALAAVTSAAGLYEDFEIAQIVGASIEQLIARDPEQHKDCCRKALVRLLPASALQRLIELHLQSKDDPAASRNTATMLRRAGTAAIELLFKRLEDETVAANRLAMLRLLGRTGSAGIEIARQRLADSRWYVVRNACLVISELKDPELLQQLTPLLQHADDRVQQAVFTAIVKGRAPGRGRILAATLRFLRGNSVEQALDEVLFLKDPATIPDLEAFVTEHAAGRGTLQRKAVQAIAAMPAAAGSEALARLVATPKLDKATRREALTAIGRAPSPPADTVISAFLATASPDDEIAAECRQRSQRAAT